MMERRNLLYGIWLCLSVYICQFTAMAQVCNSNPCMNGAQCLPPLPAQTGYTCKCTAGYTGVHCESEVDYCIPEPCENGGTCVIIPNPRGYKCKCPPGFNGVHCERNINECSTNPCNGGTCVDGINSYKCNCNSGFTGSRCEVDEDECQSNPCENGGTCKDLPNKYTCKCTPSYFGTNCEKKKTEKYPFDCTRTNTLERMPTTSGYGCSKEIHIRNFRFPFMGSRFKHIFINSQGSLSFGKKFDGSRDAENFPPKSNPDSMPPLFSGYQSFIDTSYPESESARDFVNDENMVCYQVCKDSDTDESCTSLLGRVNDEIQHYYVDVVKNQCLQDFKATWVLLATFSKVFHRPASENRDKDKTKTNTFQVLLVTDMEYSFAIVNYVAMKWDERQKFKCHVGWYKNITRYLNVDVPCYKTEEVKQKDRGASIPSGLRIYRLDALERSGEKCDTSDDPEIKCFRWYKRQKALTNAEKAYLDTTVPGCPCNWGQLTSGRRYTTWFRKGNKRDKVPWLKNIDNSDRVACAKSPPGFTKNGKQSASRVCCYNEGKGSLYTFFSVGGYMVFHPNRKVEEADFENDSYYKNVCCLESQHCDLFYERREWNELGGSCKNRRPTRRGGGIGDPHIITFDNFKYTYNAIGEFWMVQTKRVPDDSNGFSFLLQGRAGQVPSASGKATGWKAFALKDSDSRRLQVELDETTKKMKVYITKTPTSSLSDLSGGSDDISSSVYAVLSDTTKAAATLIKDFPNSYSRGFPSIILTKTSSTAFTATFQGSGFSMTFEPQGAGNLYVLSGIIAPAGKYKAASTTASDWKMRGLYGNYDGDSTNDLALPEPSTTIVSSTSDQKTIFDDFGGKWRTGIAASIFGYESGKSWSTYANLLFRPAFLEDLKTSNPTKYQEATEKCNGADNKFCVFDYLVTGSAAFASSTLKTKTDLATLQKLLDDKPPAITLYRDKVQMTKIATLGYTMAIGDTMKVEVRATEPDSELSYLQLLDQNGALAKAGAKFSITSTSQKLIIGEFTWKVPRIDAETMKLVVSFVAADKEGLISPVLTLPLHICECTHPDPTKTPPCNWDHRLKGAAGGPPEFEVFACHCDAGWEGDNCKVDHKGCVSHTCASDAECIDLTPEEEKSLSHPYKCKSCPKGYQFRVDDGKTACTDIDECKDATTAGKTLCDQKTTKECFNTEGSFNCPCKDGFVQIASDMTKCLDKNECENKADNNCDQVCTNNPGSYTCSCFPGYSLAADKKTCTQDADTARVCASLNCQVFCVKDATSAAGAKCSCKQGWELAPDKKTCKDADECKSTTKYCDQKCENKPNGEGYTCGCGVGYKLGQDGHHCEECDKNHYGKDCTLQCSCDNNKHFCDKIKGCTCSKQWTGANCEKDVDECKKQPNPCGSGTCVNTIGNYTCQCTQDFTFREGSCFAAVTQSRGFKIWEIVTLSMSAVVFLVILAAASICFIIIARIRRLKRQRDPSSTPTRSRTEESVSDTHDSLYTPASWRLPLEASYNPYGLHWMPIAGGMASLRGDDEDDFEFDNESYYDNGMTESRPPRVAREDYLDWLS